MNKNLLIIGAGSFPIEIEELAHLLNYTDIAFIDDNPDKAKAKEQRDKICEEKLNLDETPINIDENS